MYAADNDPITSLRTLEVDNLVFDMVDRCNLVCPSCYHGIHGGTKTKMSVDTCRTILDHCRDYFRPKSIWPFNWGEPLICENLGEFDLTDILDQRDRDYCIGRLRSSW